MHFTEVLYSICNEDCVFRYLTAIFYIRYIRQGKYSSHSHKRVIFDLLISSTLCRQYETKRHLL